MNIVQDGWKIGGFHRGLVRDNVDPKKQGRIKVCVPTLFEGIDSQYLPWAVPAMPFSFGGGAGSGTGCFCVPDIDTTVWVFFEGEDYNQPVYFAAAPDGVHGLPSDKDTNYPYRRVVKTASGIVLYVDDADKEAKLLHPTGKYVKMDGSGNVTVNGANINLTASGSITVNASGSITVNADGSITISGSQVDINP